MKIKGTIKTLEFLAKTVRVFRFYFRVETEKSKRNCFKNKLLPVDDSPAAVLFTDSLVYCCF